MKKFRAIDRLLIIAIIFLLMFMATVMSVPVFLKICNLAEDSREGLLAVASYQAVMAFIIPSLISAKIISRKAADYLKLNVPPRWLAVLGVFFAYLIALPALNQIIYWNEQLVFPESMRELGESLRELEERAQAVGGIMLDTTSAGGLISGILIVGILTGIAEELFFRGTLQHSLTIKGRHHLAIWLTAFIFSAFHFQVFGFIPRMLLGAWFGYLLFWTCSIYVPIIAHALNNSVVVFCTWLTNRGAEIDFEMIGVSTDGFPLAALVSCAAFIVFLAYCRRFFFYKDHANVVSGVTASNKIPSV